MTIGFPSPLGTLIPGMTTSQWTAATVSSTGAPTINNYIDDGFRMTLTTTGVTAALIRQYAAMTFNRNWLPGKNSEIDWTKPFKVLIPLRCDIGGNEFKFTIFIGGLSAAPSAHTMSGKGLSVCILGTAADAGTIQICAHNGTAQTNSTAVAQVFDGTLDWLLVDYVPGVGAALSVDGVPVASVAAAALPTGVSTSACGWAVLMEHTTVTNGTSVVQLHQFQISY